MVLIPASYHLRLGVLVSSCLPAILPSCDPAPVMIINTFEDVRPPKTGPGLHLGPVICALHYFMTLTAAGSIANLDCVWYAQLII